MIFEKTPVNGAMLVRQEPFFDTRGRFSRVFCEREFREQGVPISFLQANLCSNRAKGTLRGLHIQSGDAAEEKLIACTRGMVFDVCADVRPDSPTYGKYAAFELSEENGCMLFVPKGCAHGYLTLRDDCQLLYFISEFYRPGASLGFRYDDPLFAIDWPLKGPYILSERDAGWPYIENKP